MTKRILLVSSLAAVALGAVSLRSYGQTSPGPVTCYSLLRSTSPTYGPALTYDVRSGVAVSGYAASGTSFTAKLPIMIAGEPNPHFDRIYALLMKGAEGRLEQVCIEGDSARDGNVVSVKLQGATPSATQKVQICDSSDDCADVSFGELRTYDDNVR